MQTSIRYVYRNPESGYNFAQWRAEHGITETEYNAAPSFGEMAKLIATAVGADIVGTDCEPNIRHLGEFGLGDGDSLVSWLGDYDIDDADTIVIVPGDYILVECGKFAQIRVIDGVPTTVYQQK